MFISYVATPIETVLTFLERKDQILFQADDRYDELLRKLVAIVLMPGSVAYNTVIQDREFNADQNYNINLTLPQEIQESVPAAESEKFRKTVFSFVKRLVNYLKSKTFFHPFLYDAKHMSPAYIFKDGSVKRILEAATYFATIDNTKLFEELTLFVSPRSQEKFKDIADIDKFYVAVDQSGASPELFGLFRITSALSISNAEVERHFSRSKLIISSQMSNLKEENFNARQQIISGMKFFADDISTFPVPTSLINKVSVASRNYKRRLEQEKAESGEAEKKQRLDDELLAQIRSTQAAVEALDSEMETAIVEAGNLDKDLAAEQKSLESFLGCMVKCKNGTRMQELIQQSQLSRTTIVDMQEDYKKIQSKILALQAKKLTTK